MKKYIALLFVAIAAMAPKAIAGNPLEAISGIVTNLTSSDKFELSSLEGTWNYSSPAVSFQSESALSNIGGVAASATIESKLAPYYTKLGLTSTVLTVDKDANFTLKLKGITLKGTITKDDEAGSLTFNFAATSSIKLGKISARATKSATGVLTLTFDASRVIAIVKTVAKYSNNSSLNALSTVLDSYDGIYAGAKFKKK